MGNITNGFFAAAIIRSVSVQARASSNRIIEGKMSLVDAMEDARFREYRWEPI